MMDCPHAKSFPGVIHCQLIGHGFATSAAPCETCQTQTDGKVPDASTLPPVLVEIAAGNLPMPKPIPATPLTMRDKIRNAKAAAKAYFKSGGKRLPKEAKAERLKTCEGCEHRVMFSHLTSLLRIVKGVKPVYGCGKCGCLLEVKAMLPAEHCPLGLWENGFPPKRCCG